ncbi:MULTISPECIES: Cof-type HAD-IIB family hydrolase [Bacillus]|uniref:Cof-type HAD-IIB family hydrolase n=2 Tax=Bacillus cereus group TaxID=86661 RepID=A0A2B0XU82_BACAN|nr:MULTISPECIES: Cof-type HAD-IIB family hydrolase [Bacillus]MCU0096768.1 Cof-type HAD-IIB family hydrolase [Bacillus sp. OR9]KZD35527.1 HAD-superfamily hydrolase subfamily IIB [Bacillus cereus]MBJ8060314.1 Cof-type HAD-IIB family hydrolase [Bacillus cereus]MCU4756891.1 Cof-type HAD-IIB family hydrolase [Bacillus cereus]MCU5105730.1 Cof-type HAD-IIB family hydrolase [Bacillus cereus]
MYKVVFFDVDGTLLSEIDRSMHESTKEAIQRLIDKGIHVVVTTGRPYSLCSQFKELGIHTIISANGAHIKCGETVIHKSVISSEIVHDILGFAELHGHGVSYFTEGFAMNGIASDNERVIQALSETLNLEEYPEKSKDLSEEIYCLCLYADEIESQKFIKKYPMLTFDRFHGYVINVLEDSKVSKLTAIQKVLEHLNICESEAVAFGDGRNDIEMLQYVGLGIAMGNGGEELKTRADFVTKKASEGGIAFALKEFRII